MSYWLRRKLFVKSFYKFFSFPPRIKAGKQPAKKALFVLKFPT